MSNLASIVPVRLAYEDKIDTRVCILNAIALPKGNLLLPFIIYKSYHDVARGESETSYLIDLTRRYEIWHDLDQHR